MSLVSSIRRCGLLALYLWVGVCGVLVSGCTYRPASFDASEIRRQDTLETVELKERTRTRDGGVTLHEVRFTSLMWDSNGPRPIKIHAFVAVPPGSHAPRSKPAVIYAHGLGGQADASTAVEMARNIDVVALSLSGPGLGESEGTPVTPEDTRALFAGAEDIRRSWLYAYVYAILRSITYLETRAEVDPRALAVTGFSLGGLATFVANGVDDRIRGALPVAAAGGLLQTAAEDTWLRRLVQASGQQHATDKAPEALFRALDPLAFATRQHGAVYMLIGAQDEYFPLSQAARTFEALRAPDKRLSIFPDYDHGWYFGGGCPVRCMPGSPDRAGADCPPPPLCPTACPDGARPPYCGPQASYNREADFNARWSALLRALVAQHVAQPPRPFLPPPPLPTIEQSGDEVTVRLPASRQAQALPPVAAVRVLFSDNCGFTYSQTAVPRDQDGAYRQRVRASADSIVLAEVESAEGVVSTSIPRWPTTCRLKVRPFGPRPPRPPQPSLTRAQPAASALPAAAATAAAP